MLLHLRHIMPLHLMQRHYVQMQMPLHYVQMHFHLRHYWHLISLLDH